MEVLIKFYVGNDGKKSSLYAKLPLQFGYGSFNKPMVVKNLPTTVYVEDIISIEAVVPSSEQYAMQ